jgi:uncharacterized damage-inducible protein DinB
MPMIDAVLAELDYEARSTRRALARVPEDRLDFKPHERSMSLGRLAGHVAELPAWGRQILTHDGMDFASSEYRPFIPETTAALVARFDEAVAAFRDGAAGITDDDMMATYTLRNGDDVLFSLPRVSAIRSTVLSHVYHHRGQLTVYLRLLDVPVPAIYGPSADEADPDVDPDAAGG